jgi:hypothetical protein
MPTDSSALYDRYVAYVKRLQEDFSLHVGAGVAPRYRPQLLGPSEFTQLWQAWGVGEQAVWLQRFNQGYDETARSLEERLRAALCRARVARGTAGLAKAA